MAYTQTFPFHITVIQLNEKNLWTILNGTAYFNLLLSGNLDVFYIKIYYTMCLNLDVI